VLPAEEVRPVQRLCCNAEADCWGVAQRTRLAFELPNPERLGTRCVPNGLTDVKVHEGNHTILPCVAPQGTLRARGASINKESRENSDRVTREIEMGLYKRVAIGLSVMALAFTSSMALAQDADHTAHHATTGEPASQQQAAGCPMMSKSMMRGGMMERMGQGRQTTMGMGTGKAQDGVAPGMASLFGSRVMPTMNLTVEDVQGYLTAQLDRLNNKRLKIGDVKTDTGTITADIVTVDNSLVQRLKVDRHTGAIEYLD